MLSLKKFEKNYSGNQIGSKLVHKVVSRNSTKLLQKQFISESFWKPQLASFPPQKYLVWWPAVSAKHCRVSQPFFNDFFSHVATVSTFIWEQANDPRKYSKSVTKLPKPKPSHFILFIYWYKPISREKSSEGINICRTLCCLHFILLTDLDLAENGKPSDWVDECWVQLAAPSAHSSLCSPPATEFPHLQQTASSQEIVYQGNDPVT